MLLFVVKNIIILIIDGDDIYNNPNLHSEEQNVLEIPDGESTF
jgi:hypothetical protein